MERKTFSKVQIYVRNSYDQAKKLAMSGNYAEAVDVLLPVIKMNPEVPQLFERIREYEIAGIKSRGFMTKLWGFISSLFVAPAAFILSFIDPAKAMGLCEGPLAKCIDNPLMLWTLAFVSNAADAPWGTVSALNTIKKLHPKNTAVLRPLAVAMQSNNQAGEALRIHQAIINANPNNLALKDELRSAMALASLERGNWENGGSTQDKAADAKDAVLQQLLQGTIHDAAQAQVLIDKFTADLKEKDSVDMRRKLADAYMIAEKYEDAFREYQKVGEALGVVDPVLDKDVENAYLADCTQKIRQLQNQQAPAEQIAELEQKKIDYHREHVFFRAEKFPNDAQLQFDLAEYYFENNDIDNAEQTFSKVAEFAQKRRAALVYLGRCSLLKNEPQKAFTNLDTAAKEMYRMDKHKREALYFLAQACEQLGKNTEALDYYQKIYNSMNNYRDVSERIAALSGSQPEQPTGDAQ